MMRLSRSVTLTRATAVVGALALAGCGATAAPGSAEPKSAAVAVAAVKAATVASTTCADGANQVASLAPGNITADPDTVTNSPTLDRIRKAGHLTLGTSGDVLLWGATNPENGDLEGFDVLVAAEVAIAAGVEPEKTVYKVVNYAERLSSLESESVDLVAHTMTINCARWEGTGTAPNPINFSTEYYRAGQKVLVRKDSKATKIQDLKGQRVCLPAASTNIDNVEGMGLKLVELDAIGECLVKFQEGEVDAITGDDTVLAGFVAQDDFAKLTGEQFSQEPYGLGIKADDPQFTQFVNAVLEKLRSNGRLAEIYAETMGKALPGETLSVPEPVYGRNLAGLKRKS